MIAQRDIDAGRFFQNGFLMAECFETFFPVIRTDAGISDASKSHMRRGEMNDRIVDTAAAERDLCQNFFLRAAVCRKKVELSLIHIYRRRERNDEPGALRFG